MRFLTVFLLLLFCLACGDAQNSLKAPIANYSLQGDLEKIQAKGQLRLLLNTFDYLEPNNLHKPSLSRDVEQAEAFARSLNLTPVLIYANSNERLIELLNQGYGDLLVSNLSQTNTRRQLIDFSMPIEVEDEVMVYSALKGAPDLHKSSFVLAVKSGSAYVETAEKLQKNNPKITIKKLPAETADIDVLTGIDNGDYLAAVLDKTLAENYLNGWSSLRIGPLLRADRLISWGIRKKSPQLKRELDGYLLSHSILSSQNRPALHDYAEIKKQKLLRVITLNSPASYFIWRGEFKGFDYEMMREFAKEHGLRLQMIVRDSPEAMIASLFRGEGDVIAGSLTVNKARDKQGLVYSQWYLQVMEQLIGRRDMPAFADVKALDGKTITVNPYSSFHKSLVNLQNQGIKLDIKSQPAYSSAELIDAVAQGREELTVADSHLASIEVNYLENIQVLLNIGESRNIACGLRLGQPELKKQLDSFIQTYYKSLHYNLAYQKYFVEQQQISSNNAERITGAAELSPYDDLFKSYAVKYNYDWRLIAAQAYQESKFNPKATSFAGAEGLMQIMPRTGKSLGYNDLYNVEQNIAAAMEFLLWLEQRFPRNLPIQEKMYFSLAAYNAGHGHVNDARILAKRIGKNPNLWFDNVEEAMALLSKPKYYRTARHGYVRGQEPVKYVREIRSRYLAYVQAGK